MALFVSVAQISSYRCWKNSDHVLNKEPTASLWSSASSMACRALTVPRQSRHLWAR